MRRGPYTLALYVLAPLIWLWMCRRARRSGGDWGIWSPARFGRPDPANGVAFPGSPVWVHAVSLGETRAAQPLIEALLDQGLPVLLTHTTATGRAEGARLFAQALESGQLRQTWLPYDFPGAVRRFFAHHRPRCGLLIEREVWPNLLAEARRQGVRMALVSARFSASSLRQARWLGRALREALAGLDAVLAQTAQDAERLQQAGVKSASVTGNLKFDMRLAPDQLRRGQQFRHAVARPIVVVASTREGEDALFAQAIRDWQAHAANRAEVDHSSVLFILIPRHPQRFAAAAAALDEAGLVYRQRSQMSARAQPGRGLQMASTDARKGMTTSLEEPAEGFGDELPSLDSEITVLLGDSLGEMAFYYGAADVAIVAGSFLPFGGQNLIEACAAGIPTIVGPHTFNFKQAAQDAIAAGAVCQADDARTALARALALLGDAPRRSRMGDAASSWASSHAGATARTLAALRDWWAPQSGSREEV